MFFFFGFFASERVARAAAEQPQELTASSRNAGGPARGEGGGLGRGFLEGRKGGGQVSVYEEK